MEVSIDLEEGESYDIFRFHILGGNIIHKSPRPRDVLKMSWKKLGWPFYTWAYAHGLRGMEHYSTLEVRAYRSFWQTTPMVIDASGVVIDFEFDIWEDSTPCIFYAWKQLDGARTPLHITNVCDGPAKAAPTWAGVKELYR